MKELMARELLMQDDLLGVASSIDQNPNFDSTVKFGIGAIFGADEHQNVMNQSEYSKLIRRHESGGAGGK